LIGPIEVVTIAVYALVGMLGLVMVAPGGRYVIVVGHLNRAFRSNVRMPAYSMSFVDICRTRPEGAGLTEN
jgi:hypothetical protein